MDINNIGTFGISFSRDLDQSWLNLWRKDYGYSLDFYENVEGTNTEDDADVTEMKISFEEGEKLLSDIFERGKLESWQTQYKKEDEGLETSLNWTIDVDDLNDEQIFMISGNWKMPAEMMEVLKVIRTHVEHYGKCFEDLR